MKVKQSIQKYLSIFLIAILLLSSFPNVNHANEASLIDDESTVETVEENIDNEEQSDDKSPEIDEKEEASKDKKEEKKEESGKSKEKTKDPESDKPEKSEKAEEKVTKEKSNVTTQAVEEEEDSEEPSIPSIEEINENVKKDLVELKSAIKERNLLDKQAYVWAYAKAGGQVPTAYYDDIVSQLKQEENFTNGYNEINEIAKVIIALSAGGFDASNLDGTNLVEMLLDKNIPSQGAVATQAYALHAFDIGNYEVSENVKKEIVASIIDKQTSSGGWAHFGDTPSPDITGMVLNALAPYKDDSHVEKAIDKAVAYLADGFDGTGWYHDQWSGGYTSEAISQVVLGLTAVGIDPTEEPFVDEDGKALLSYLLEFKADDGLYKHVANGGSDLGFATSQAFLALAYYGEFAQLIEKDSIVEEEEEEEKELTAGDVYFTVPEDAELFIGQKSKHFVKFIEEDVTETIENDDGTITYYYDLSANKEYNYRVSAKGKLTNTGKFKADTKNHNLEVTEEQLEIHGPNAILNRGTHIEGNIYLNINEQNHLQLEENETFKLLPMRSWQALIEGIENYFFEPDYNYEIVTGEDVISVTPDGPGSYAEITAKKQGTAIVKVTYDALKVNGSAYEDGEFSAIWPENVGLFVVTVSDDQAELETGIESNKERNIAAGKNNNLQQGVFDSEIDSVYYLEGEKGAEYTFTPPAGSDVEILRPVISDDKADYGDGSFTKENVTNNEDESFTILLTEGRNIVKVTNGDAVAYHVMTARPLDVTIDNLSNVGKEVKAGDEVKVTFEGLSFPANKLAGIYNFMGQLHFSSHDEKETFSGDRRQYNMATQANHLTFTVPADHKGPYQLKDGRIGLSFFGSPIGTHHNMNAETGAAPNMNAVGVEGYYSIFPEIEIIPGEEKPELPVVDKTKLESTIDEAKNIDLSDKTEASKKEFEKALDKAKLVLKDEKASQKSVDAAIENLTEAIENLEEEPKLPVVDKTKLESKIEEAEKVDLTNKTDDSKKEFEKALENAKSVLKDEKASQEAVDDAGKTLEAAMKNLADRGPPSTTTKTVDVRVEGLKETLLPTTTIEVEVFDISPYVTSGNASQYDEARAVHAIIEGLKSIEGFDPKDDNQFRLADGGNYIVKIGDDAEFSAGDLSGWMYHVNNESAPVGIADYKIEDGDSIVVYFVENFMDSAIVWFNKDNYKVQVDESLTLRLDSAANYDFETEEEVETSIEGAHLLVDGKVYQVDGEPVLFDKDGKATVTFDEPGNYDLSAERYNKDGQGNIVRPAATVEVVEDPVEPEEDKTAPKITVSGVKDGNKYLSPELKFNVKAIDDVDGVVKPTVKFNGEPIEAKNGDTYAVTLKEGENKIVVQAVDAANNEATKEIRVIYEKPTLDASSEKALEDLIAYVLKTGVDSEWLAVGLQQAGVEVPADYEEVFKENVQDQVVQALKNNRMNITDVERLTLAALAINKDPRNIAGTNLLELIYNSPEREIYDGTVVDTLTYQGNNGIAFALIALDAGKFDIPNNAKWTREKLVDELIAAQRDDGAWNLNDTHPEASVDVTAMVLTALAPYKDNKNVTTAIDKAVTYLSNAQTKDGGFDGGTGVGGITSEAASQVVIALTALGIDPKGEEFTKSMNLIDHLLSFQLSNGGFVHTLGDSEADDMATEQALLALAAYKRYVENDTPLYDFDTSTLEEIEKDEEEGNTDLPGSENDDPKQPDLEKPNDQDSDSTVEDKSNEEDEKTSEKLPSTATNNYNFLFAGLVLFVLGLVVMIYRRKKLN